MNSRRKIKDAFIDTIFHQFRAQLAVCMFYFPYVYTNGKGGIHMDLMKIGKFIAEKRKEIGLTQSQLAEELHITDRAISKWECGRSLPDSSIMLSLCKILGINVNELLMGEEIQMDTYNSQAEENLIQMVKEKEESDRRLLRVEIVLGIVGSLFEFAMVILGILGYVYLNLPLWAMIVMIVIGSIVFIVTMLFCILIEQKAGYYECKICHQRFVPTYKQVLFAPHINRSRYMKCPHCGKKSYHKKVISK